MELGLAKDVCGEIGLRNGSDKFSSELTARVEGCGAVCGSEAKLFYLRA
jgi:hypothetical protein